MCGRPFTSGVFPCPAVPLNDACAAAGSQTRLCFPPCSPPAPSPSYRQDTVKHPAMCAQRLVTEALARGGGDNVACAVAFLNTDGSTGEQPVASGWLAGHFGYWCGAHTRQHPSAATGLLPSPASPRRPRHSRYSWPPPACSRACVPCRPPQIWRCRGPPCRGGAVSRRAARHLLNAE